MSRIRLALLIDKKQAIQYAGEVKHVRHVISFIRVKTERVPDAWLLKQLQDRLAADQEGQIKLKVKEGVVTMQGLVQHGHRDKVWSTIASTAGVIGIKDQLRIAAN